MIKRKIKNHRSVQPALFLDRDGVINEDVGYPYRVEQLTVFPGVAETIAQFRRFGYYVIVVTNQSGIARGFFSVNDMHRFNEHLRARLLADHDESVIDAIYFCPHHPEGEMEQYRINCDCRKPGIGMIQQACVDFSIDLGKSFLVGDKATDVACGFNAGVKTVQIIKERRGIDIIADYEVHSLQECRHLVSEFK